MTDKAAAVVDKPEDPLRETRARRAVWEARLSPCSRVLCTLTPALRGETHPASAGALALLACGAYVYLTCYAPPILRVLGALGIASVVLPFVLAKAGVDAVGMITDKLPADKDAVAEIAHLIVSIESMGSKCCGGGSAGSKCCGGGWKCLALGAVLYFLGGLLSGWTLCLLVVLGLALTPAAMAHEVHIKIDRAVRPKIEMVSDKVGTTLAPVTAFINSKLGGGGAAPAAATATEEAKKDK